MRRKQNAIFLVICFLKSCYSTADNDLEYIEESDQDSTRRFYFEGSDENHDELEHQDYDETSQYQYDDSLPFGKLSDKETLTIEQFVNELKRRKEAKERQKVKEISKGKANKGIKKNVIAKKEKSKGSKRQKTKTKSPNEQKSSTRPRKTTSTKGSKRKQKAKSSKTGGKQTQKKAKSQKSKGQSSKKTETERKPSIKNKVKPKPSRKQKPYHKPKKDTKHTNKDQEDEDPFQIGNSQSHQHSDHHIHQHDHLEAHKHHHKHKESHDHAHDHSNDHVHNHKHNHNHVHNHIHKHNEAHEHTAEHSHTEKHHHKHLEYIDAGGWRRRNDIDGEAILEGGPTELVIENRSLGKDLNPKDNVKNYLKKYIEFYKTAAGPDDESYSDDSENDSFTENSIQENQSSLQFDDSFVTNRTEEDNTRNFQGFNDEERKLFDSQNFDFNTDQYQPEATQHEAELLQDETDQDEDVEEISFEEYLALQKKGPNFEEAYEDYNEGQSVQYSSNDYEDDYPAYDDQVGFGTNNDLIRLDFNNFDSKNHWVPETSELVPIQELEIDLYDENQWRPQAEFALERSDDTNVVKEDSELYDQIEGKREWTEENGSIA